MNKKYLTILVIALIFLGSLVVIGLNEINRVNKQTYEVNEEPDNARTFAVYTDGILTGFGNENGTWALLQLSSSYSFGVKFDNITIDQCAKIKTAYIDLYSVGTPNNRHPNCKIYCDDMDNAVNFVEKGVLDISGRIYTENYTLWNETVEFLKWTKTPSLVNPVQEVINRRNWVAGNSIAFLFITEGLFEYSATFQNFENGYPAKLYIEWT